MIDHDHDQCELCQLEVADRWRTITRDFIVFACTFIVTSIVLELVDKRRQ